MGVCCFSASCIAAAVGVVHCVSITAVTAVANTAAAATASIAVLPTGITAVTTASDTVAVIARAALGEFPQSLVEGLGQKLWAVTTKCQEVHVGFCPRCTV